MGRRIRVGAVLAAVVIASTSLASVAAQGSLITEPVTFELVSTGSTITREWALSNEDDQHAVMSLLVEDVADPDGTKVGTHTWQCLLSEPIGWFCTGYLDLEASSQTAPGTLVVIGAFEGFSGESMAVVGGTGAYASVRGEAILEARDDTFVRRITLYP